MSDPHIAQPTPSTPDKEPVLERALVVAEPLVPASDTWLVPRKWALVVAALAAGGLLASGLLWQKLATIQEELARRSLDSGAQAIEARALARQAQEATRELSARLAIQETRISEVSLQRTQLEELMQSLSRSRDENLVVDVESALRLAQQQAQLTGSAEPLLAALKSADQRLARAAQPRLNPLQRAIARDMDRIKAATLTDVPVLMLKLDELARLADDLPVANAMVANSPLRAVPALAATAPAARASAPAADKPSEGMFDKLSLSAWSQRTLDNLRDEARKLLRVSRIEQPEAALLSPEQSFFLRENLKLRLLNARLALLSRQSDSVRTDLASASAWLGKYFDPSSRKTQAAAQLLAQVQGQLKTSELPRLDETMAALATAAAGR
ncbi:uroporphyrinogen-III C-methyltransferase [Polaromonas sp. JS666]|uniref:uroporphyrinogen-III C-methyltransferase n=1 Tax=Polaromonas sp. (strain JS666 / ATCC BAA-500) TaxID=296591 RepID=UPI000892561F|nr:uroporphyrinogen-III C-methyltransferase [Polaromonas sp. JS666]SDN34604.1 uroporphyrin-3 C-methyltransferase [Polaromonas sp. JS666]